MDNKIPVYVLSDDKKDSIKNKIAKWVRANIFIPDAKIGWIPYAVRTGLNIIKQEQINAIFSTSPPHSLQIIAHKLKKITKVNWISDFRDPWSGAFWQQDSPQGKWAAQIEKKIESVVLNNSDHIITASSGIMQKFKSEYKNKYTVITNGFDFKDYNNLKKEKSDKFQISYFGNLSRTQVCENLFNGLSKFNENIEDEFEINFYGNVHPGIRSQIKNNNLEKITNFKPYLSHIEAIQQMINSDILLLTIPNVSDNRGIIPGKIFEYIASGNRILAIGPKDSDVAKILKESGTGSIYNYSESPLQAIFDSYNHWKHHPSNQHKLNLDLRYERKNLTKELTNILDNL